MPISPHPLTNLSFLKQIFLPLLKQYKTFLKPLINKFSFVKFFSLFCTHSMFWCICFLPELKRKKKKLYNLEGQQPISKHIALLYKDIEKNGWIELTCKCPRRGQTKKESQPQTSQSSTNSVVTKLDSYHLPIGQSPSKSKSR